VNESDLASLNGFPGPLRETLGIWREEVDALYPEDRNALVWKGRSYEAFEICELIHTGGAEALGAYGADFYAGRPALTVNKRGGGKAYFIAARTGNDFLDDFYRFVAADASVKRALEAELPTGVTAQIRSGGEKDFIFLLNFTPRAQQVDIGTENKCLEPFGSLIIERKRE
jgi:beta-galactosidase